MDESTEFTPHTEEHPQAGKVVRLGQIRKTGTLASGAEVEVIDWYDRSTGTSWKHAQGRVALAYAYRIGLAKKEIDDEVVLVRTTSHPVMEHLVHVSELA